MTRQALSIGIIVFWLLIAIAGILQPPDITHIDLQGMLQAPTTEHLLGQDDLGRSQLARLVYGARISLLVAVAVTLATAILGIFIGAIAGWVGGAVDHLLLRLIDVFMAFPGILLAMALAGILGPGISNLIIALSVVGWVSFARLTRAQVFAMKNREHVLAARSMGVLPHVIVLRHVLPLISAPLIVEATYAMASVIIAEAGLSFLGIGIQPPEASWGLMIRDGSRYLLIAPHMVLVPGLALASLVFAVNSLGDVLRDRNDSKMKHRTTLHNKK